MRVSLSLRFVMTAVFAFLPGCQAVWGSFNYPDAENCAPDPGICGAAMECNGQTERCEPSLPLPVLARPAWKQQSRLTANDGAALDKMGTSLSLSGDTLLTGAYEADVTGPGRNEGAAYVFVRDPVTKIFSQTAKLVTNDSQMNDRTGSAVSLSGDTALVSAPTAAPAGLAQAGAAYVFVGNQGTFLQQAKLLPSDPEMGARFGHSVSLDRDRALVGANLATEAGKLRAGAAYVFNRNPSTGVWTQQVPRLVAADGVSDDQFGFAVGLSGDRALIGSVQADPGGKPMAGAAYVFAHNPTSGLFEQEAKLLANDGVGNEQFGYAVAISGDTALIGAPNTTVGGRALTGAAYVFVRDPSSGTWSQQAKLVAPDGQAGDLLGSAVALSGERAVVTARQADVDGRSNAGAAYVFRRATGQTTWVFEIKLTATDAAQDDLAGFGMSLSGDTLVLGAPSKDRGADLDVGAAYTFRLARQNGDPCTARTECLSAFCVDGVCCDSACGNADPLDCQACSAAAGALVLPQEDGTCRPRRPGRLCRASMSSSNRAESCDGRSLLCPADGSGT